MIRFRTIFGWTGAVALLLVTSVGCPESGSTTPSARLQGTVTLNGGQIPSDAQADITFRPIGASAAVSGGSPIKDGKYDVPDAPMGTVKVEINIVQPTGKKADDGRSVEAEYKSLVPPSWSDGQEIQVAGDKSDLNFDIK